MRARGRALCRPRLSRRSTTRTHRIWPRGSSLDGTKRRRPGRSTCPSGRVDACGRLVDLLPGDAAPRGRPTGNVSLVGLRPARTPQTCSRRRIFPIIDRRRGRGRGAANLGCHSLGRAVDVFQAHWLHERLPGVGCVTGENICRTVPSERVAELPRGRTLHACEVRLHR